MPATGEQDALWLWLEGGAAETLALWELLIRGVMADARGVPMDRLPGRRPPWGADFRGTVWHVRMDEVMDHRRGRGHPRGEHVLPEERVHEGALPVVELAHDDEVEAIGLDLLDDLEIDPRSEALRPDCDARVAERGEAEDDLGPERVIVLERHQPTTLMIA